MVSIRAVAGLRAGWGAALALRTEPLLRMMMREEPSGSLVLFARTVGIRDLVFGLGSLLAPREGPSGVRRWLSLWLMSDVADVVAGITGVRHIGRSGAAAAALAPLPFVAAGAWALRRLSTRTV